MRAAIGSRSSKDILLPNYMVYNTSSHPSCGAQSLINVVVLLLILLLLLSLLPYFFFYNFILFLCFSFIIFCRVKVRH
jgi:hypothetical protein